MVKIKYLCQEFTYLQLFSSKTKTTSLDANKEFGLKAYLYRVRAVAGMHGSIVVSFRIN
jgi:hypothetical protein